MLALGAKKLVEIIEGAYRVELEPSEWLKNATALVGPHLDAGLGVCSYFVDMSEPETFITSHYSGTGMLGGVEGEGRFSRWAEQVPVAMKRHAHSFGACGTSVTIPHMPDGESIVPKSRKAHGIGDLIGMNSIDATGRGCSMAAPLPKPSRGIPPKPRAHLERVAMHLAAGLRIVRKLRPPEAVIAPDGKVLHAEGEAKHREARETLRKAATRIDRMRLRSQRLEPEEVTNVWRALVAGRWSLLDQFEQDGRRYFIAQANAPEMPEQPKLSEREAQVVGALARGHGNQVIAYELGITPSSVATHIARASKKLGVRSRAMLISAFFELSRK